MIKKQDILLSQLIGQRKGTIVSDMGGEKVILSVQNGKYYNLGEIGGAIWDCIEKPISFSQLVAELMSQYEVERSECEEQVITFLEMLLAEGLLELGEEA